VKPDESNIGIILGLICVALALLPWIPMDLWLKKNGHEVITKEFHELMVQGGWWALVACGVIGAILFIAAYHFFYQR
jgi:hypothetical protein